MHTLKILAASLALPMLVNAQSKASIGWKNYADSVLRAARESGKPLLVEVWGEWCPPCRRMDREVWSDTRISELASKFVCVSLEVGPSGPRLDQDVLFGSHGLHRVRAYPTIVIMDPWREVLLLIEGFTPVNELAPILREIPADYNGVRTWRDALEQERNNSRALERVGALYDSSRAFGIANRYYREALKGGAAKEDKSLRESLMFQIATNEVRRADWKAARKGLERFNAEFPDSPLMDQVLLGLVLTDSKEGKAKLAEEHCKELSARFPNSKAAAVAEGIVTRSKAAGKK